jgi:hypothetical protein
MTSKFQSGFSGLRTSAYFLGSASLNLIDITVQPAIFMSLYYTLTLPEIDFVNYYVVAWLVAWYSSGLGYWASVAMAPQNSMVAAATSIMVLGGFLNGVDPRFRSLSPLMKHVIGQPLLPSFLLTAMRSFRMGNNQPREIGGASRQMHVLRSQPLMMSL